MRELANTSEAQRKRAARAAHREARHALREATEAVRVQGQSIAADPIGALLRAFLEFTEAVKAVVMAGQTRTSEDVRKASGGRPETSESVRPDVRECPGARARGEISYSFSLSDHTEEKEDQTREARTSEDVRKASGGRPETSGTGEAAPDADGRPAESVELPIGVRVSDSTPFEPRTWTDDGCHGAAMQALQTAIGQGMGKGTRFTLARRGVNTATIVEQLREREPDDAKRIDYATRRGLAFGRSDRPKTAFALIDWLNLPEEIGPAPRPPPPPKSAEQVQRELEERKHELRMREDPEYREQYKRTVRASLAKVLEPQRKAEGGS